MIRKTLLLACVFVPPAWVPPALAQDPVAGHYNLTRTTSGTELYGVMDLEQAGDLLSGKYSGDDLTGTRP